ncbi:MAG: hypothetical protein JSS34_04130 [Proteobacteria bacterium]|nr:hypothetical protein [Pseudomonadota bacterium]
MNPFFQLMEQAAEKNLKYNPQDVSYKFSQKENHWGYESQPFKNYSQSSNIWEKFINQNLQSLNHASQSPEDMSQLRRGHHRRDHYWRGGGGGGWRRYHGSRRGWRGERAFKMRREGGSMQKGGAMEPSLQKELQMQNFSKKAIQNKEALAGTLIKSSQKRHLSQQCIKKNGEKSGSQMLHGEKSQCSI